jgi:hypothetical protein
MDGSVHRRKGVRREKGLHHMLLALCMLLHEILQMHALICCNCMEAA